MKGGPKIARRLGDFQGVFIISRHFPHEKECIISILNCVCYLFLPSLIPLPIVEVPIERNTNNSNGRFFFFFLGFFTRFCTICYKTTQLKQFLLKGRVILSGERGELYKYQYIFLKYFSLNFPSYCQLFDTNLMTNEMTTC